MLKVESGNKKALVKLKQYLRKGGRVVDIATHFNITSSAVYSWTRREVIPFRYRLDLLCFLDSWFLKNKDII